MSGLIQILKISNNTFPGQEPGEQVVMVLRRHPFFIIMHLFVLVLFAILALILFLVFLSDIKAADLFSVSLFLLSVFYLFLWQSAFYFLTMYMLDVWIVTDHRIIDSRQNGFFHQTISVLHLTRVQDITINVHGILGSFLKFGDLEVQTAGEEEKFIFLKIPNPEDVKNKIMSLTIAHAPKNL